METEPLIKYSGYAIGMHVWVTNPSNNNVVYGRIVSVKIKNCGYRNAEGDEFGLQIYFITVCHNRSINPSGLTYFN